MNQSENYLTIRWTDEYKFRKVKSIFRGHAFFREDETGYYMKATSGFVRKYITMFRGGVIDLSHKNNQTIKP